MNYNEKAIEVIKTRWFKDHVAEITGEEGLQVIQWGKPGTNMYRKKYILSGANIFISGDIGEAVYSLTCLATLENINDFGLHYFTKKLTAFCNDRWDFDNNAARRDLKENWNDYEMDNMEDSKDVYNQITSVIRESANVREYQRGIMDVYENTSLETDDMEWLYDLGQVMPYRLIAYWVGLQMTIEQLIKNKPAAEAVTL
ncbi:hypothetical protein [Bacillus wiedmannii]|uniref:EH domain-containing protein n=1 Tax=Bacillus wiedmannii TaxID=1890302 RepID=A0A1C4DGT6_9BACI|nr:hypothetical protein [Bacillus wiedmannii]SCC30503.1 Uncharacterized protein BC05F1_02649 [Bacillus wiedmannii]